MLDLLVTAIFWVLNFIANIILQPVMWLLSVLVGNTISSTVGMIINSIFSLLALVDEYVIFAVDILCIPHTLFTLVFTLVAGIITYVVFARIYIFSMAIYNHFKP